MQFVLFVALTTILARHMNWQGDIPFNYLYFHSCFLLILLLSVKTFFFSKQLYLLLRCLLQCASRAMLLWAWAMCGLVHISVYRQTAQLVPAGSLWQIGQGWNRCGWVVALHSQSHKSLNGCIASAHGLVVAAIHKPAFAALKMFEWIRDVYLKLGGHTRLHSFY